MRARTWSAVEAGEHRSASAADLMIAASRGPRLSAAGTPADA
ncbi:hypothetical protein [Streptomyces sp. N35]|nr:hypothetical protein [Streptomyces sp. N35]